MVATPRHSGKPRNNPLDISGSEGVKAY